MKTEDYFFKPDQVTEFSRKEKKISNDSDGTTLSVPVSEIYY